VELTDTVIDLTPDEFLRDEDMAFAAVTDALTHCAWCDLELEPAAGREVGIRVEDRDRLSGSEGLVITLFTDDDQALPGILAGADRPAAASGNDLIFKACSSRCEKLIHKNAPKALRRFLRRLAAEEIG
jgi:hypothetical protein